MTEAEKVICRLYLEDMDRNHTCNEYRLLMELLDREPCEDAISRQAAIDAINCDITITGKQNAEVVAETIASFVDRIKALPSAQPETAKRIVGKSRDGMTLWYQCDMCNEPVDAQDNFCRGCGRRLTDG